MVIRIVRLLLVSLIGTGLVFASNMMPTFNTAGASSSIYEVSAKDLQLNCTGPALLAGGKSGTSVTGFGRSGSAAVSISYSGATNTTLSLFGLRQVIGFANRQELDSRISNSQTLRVKDQTGKTAQGSKLLTANQLQLSTVKQMRGLLAAPCLRPQSEFWLVGGSTKVGREALLILNNASLVDATVDLEIFTENGNSHSAGLSGISVPKGRTTVIPLASFVLSAESIAVHVQSQGGSITAFIQQKAVRGLSASGADYISPSETISTESYFPGILIRGSFSSAKLRKNGPRYSDVQNMLRVYVPGEVDAKLTLQILGTTAETFGTVVQLDAPAGKVSDFDIKGLFDGDYFGVLQSNVPVRSAIRLVRSSVLSDSYTDFAWINAAAEFSETRYIAVPKAGISKLSLVNASNKPTSVTLKIGAATVVRRIAALSEEVVRAAPGLAIGITPGETAIRANLIIDVQGRVSAIPVLDEKNISGQVKISVH